MKQHGAETAPAAPAIPQNDTPEEHHKRRTVGNKIYDWGIYTTFAWAGVAGLSLLSAHEAMHGNNPNFNWLRKMNDGIMPVHCRLQITRVGHFPPHDL